MGAGGPLTTLLDVNVLVALAWPNHIHHRRAVAWFVEARSEGWATCPTTESGFVRVSSNTRAIPDARTPGEAIGLLTQLRGSGQHDFWEDTVTLTADPFDIFARVVGHRQVTDSHLLTLALHQGGCFATFDRALHELAGSHRESVLLID